MQSNKLSWNTQQVGRYTFPFVYWDSVMSVEDLAILESYCNQIPLESSATIGAGDAINKTDSRVSKSRIVNFDHNNLWVFDRLRVITEHANSEYFNFDLNGFDYFQYAEYQGQGSHYDYHTDIIYGNQLPHYMQFSRKLSFSLILSNPNEYTGGEFQLKTDTDKPITVEQTRGRLIGFPSWILHRVAPLQSGVRKSIVWWATGPKFR